MDARLREALGQRDLPQVAWRQQVLWRVRRKELHLCVVSCTSEVRMVFLDTMLGSLVVWAGGFSVEYLFESKLLYKL